MEEYITSLVDDHKNFKKKLREFYTLTGRDINILGNGNNGKSTFVKGLISLCPDNWVTIASHIASDVEIYMYKPTGSRIHISNNPEIFNSNVIHFNNNFTGSAERSTEVHFPADARQWLNSLLYDHENVRQLSILDFVKYSEGRNRI